VTAALRVVALASAAAALAVLFALAVPGVAWADALTPKSGGSPNADEIDSLYKIVLALAIAVFVGVEGMLVYSLARFRARRGRVAAQIHGNTRLEVGWTLAAVLLVVLITLITFLKLGSITDPPRVGSSVGGTGDAAAASATVAQPRADRTALRIGVSGQQYIWRYEYPGGVVAYTELVVPTDTTVRLNIVSEDVAHSWWIPELGGKADAIPGYTNHAWFHIPREGVFRGQCAELCGRNHAEMVAQVRALEPPRFRAWLADKRRELAAARRLGRSNAPRADRAIAHP
jgi:cytochrome c oxidase subunit 2